MQYFLAGGEPTTPPRDALIETMRTKGNAIPLWQYHYARLQKSVPLLWYGAPSLPPQDAFLENILLQIPEIEHGQPLRVRLQIDFDDYTLSCAISYSTIYTEYQAGYDKIGLRVCIYDDAPLAAHLLSKLKRIPQVAYSRAAQYATAQGLDDAFVINNAHCITESSIANVFWVEGDKLYTPPLSEGCIAGVFRSYMLDNINGIEQQPLTLQALENASEVWLSNAVRGIRWVVECAGKRYGNRLFETYKKLNAIILNGS
ncbi:MAG: hypothetical protein EBX41_08355 [Chitinophagia bacterium]|nr:hypothetical protein [Chitinophagia bacterium]